MDELEKVVMDALTNRIIELNKEVRTLKQYLNQCEQEQAALRYEMRHGPVKTGNVPDEK